MGEAQRSENHPQRFGRDGVVVMRDREEDEVRDEGEVDRIEDEFARETRLVGAAVRDGVRCCLHVSTPREAQSLVRDHRRAEGVT